MDITQAPKYPEEMAVPGQLGLAVQARTEVLGHCPARAPAAVHDQWQLLGDSITGKQGPQVPGPWGVPGQPSGRDARELSWP
ncbi:MAG: hypothetical protein ACYCXN_09560 [Acidimicrobiales bacterium]|jgi:hypothetical protein